MNLGYPTIIGEEDRLNATVKTRGIWIPQIVAIGMLLYALSPDNPYGYYVILRWICCGIFAYLAIQALKRGKQDWVWILGITALIYNPIFSVHLIRGIWEVVNIVTIVIAIISIVMFRKGKP